MQILLTFRFPRTTRPATPSDKGWLGTGRTACAVALLGMLALSKGKITAQPFSFAGDAQHTSTFEPAAQPLNFLRWSTSVNTFSPNASWHYGAPLVTASNTVLVPAPVINTTGFQIKAFTATTGQLKYTLATDYRRSFSFWGPPYQPAIATPPSGPRLYYPGAGGTVYFVENIDADAPSAPVQQCFYTNLTGYLANSNAFNNSIVISTPITSDTNGNIFFGFGVAGTAPAPLSTTNGGFARLDPAGNATYVLAGTAAGDSRYSQPVNDSGPALSNDGNTLYVAARHSGGATYLLGLDSVTLETKYKVLLRDPRNTNNVVQVNSSSTASPTIGPDGDVYFGVGLTGFLLHFSGDLSVTKTPGGFGWDFTAGIVPTNIVPSYKGTSPYLLFAKYNDYGSDGNNINRIALLDPNATQIDPHPSANGLKEMREVLTVISPTPDPNTYGGGYPFGVREWCINAVAVNPATRSIFAPCEDGRVYRWDLAANSLVEAFTTGPGVGQPYVPTVIGPDGAVYTFNGAKLFALGGFTNIAMTIQSSAPDMRNVVAGQPVMFTASVSNLNASDPLPTGTVTFLDRTHRGVTSITNTLAANVPLTNGVASVTISNLSAGGIVPTNALGNHLINATYNGDTNFPAASVSLMQKVHASGTTTTISSALSNNAVVFTATVAPILNGLGKPTGMVSFWDGNTFLAQLSVNTNGIAAFTTTNFSSGSHAVSVEYASDTMFTASSAAIVGTQSHLTGFSVLSNGLFQVTFTNVIGAPFRVLGSPDWSKPLGDWSVLGSAIEIQPGQFQFTDYESASDVQRFYRVCSP